MPRSPVPKWGRASALMPPKGRDRVIPLRFGGTSEFYGRHVGWGEPHRRVEDDLAVDLVDQDRLAGPELLVQELLGQRVLHEPLDRAPQRSSAQRLIPPRSARNVLARSVNSMSTSLALSCSSTRRISRSTICFTSPVVSEWNTMTSSMRLMNSGRKDS